MSASPSLVFGARSLAKLFEPRLGVLDRGVTGINMLVRSHRLAPDGAGGACIFRSLVLAVRHQGTITLNYRVLVDDIQVISGSLPPLAVYAARRSYTLQIPLSLPLLVSGVVVSRQRPQGTWIQVEVSTSQVASFAIDGLDVEWDQVQRRES